MVGVLTGFGTLGLVVAVGWLISRIGLIGPDGSVVLSRLVFTVATPLLLFQNLSTSAGVVSFSSAFVVAAVTAVAVALIYFCLARVVWRRPFADAIAGTMGASISNSTYLGIPISVYVLGNASYVAPLLFFQIVFFTPLTTTLFRMAVSGRSPSLRSVARAVLGNPVLIGAVLGMLVGAVGWELPPVLADPVGLIGAMAVPGALLAFGMSLNGARPLAERTQRLDALTSTLLKLAVQPALAWGLALGLGLQGTELLAVVVCAALPTGQNVFITATSLGRSSTLTRDIVLLTTLGSAPVLLLLTAVVG